MIPIVLDRMRREFLIDDMFFSCVEGGASGFLTLLGTNQLMYTQMQEQARVHCHASTHTCVRRGMEQPLRGLKSDVCKSAYKHSHSSASTTERTSTSLTW